MLLTRAPLNQTSITTNLVPCDLHVLNTPPAFVLSQNQTLRKSPVVSFFTKPLNRTTFGLSSGPVGLSHPTPARRGLNRPRGAQFNLFPLPSRPTCYPSENGFFSLVSPRRIPATGTWPAEPYCQRACFEGTKKPISVGRRLNLAPIDSASLASPASGRRANPKPNRPRRSISFQKVFRGHPMKIG